MRIKHTPVIVVDTNVWISGLIFGGKPGKIIELFAEKRLVVVSSEQLLSELRRKITERFPLFLPQLELLEASIRKDAEIVRLGGRTIRVSRDPKDDMFIETAVQGRCEYIVSGDKDLLVLRNYDTVEIIKPADFLNKLGL